MKTIKNIVPSHKTTVKGDQILDADTGKAIAKTFGNPQVAVLISDILNMFMEEAAENAANVREAEEARAKEEAESEEEDETEVEETE